MDNSKPVNVLIVAGEVSGDNHASALVNRINQHSPGIRFYGIGGDRMREEGVVLVEHIERMAFLGFIEVIKHIPFIKKVQNKLMREAMEHNITSAVLVDYPGFNLNFARKLRKAGIKVIYYISPQIWAWAPWRINKIKKLVDKILCVFPFEKALYDKAGVPCVYTGHPLVEKFRHYSYQPKEEFFSEFGLNPDKEILLILPGSRRHEITEIFSESLEAAGRLAEKYNLQVVVAGAPTIGNNIYEEYAAGRKYTLIRGKSLELMRYAKFGIIKSGTSTMEAGLSLLPMVVVYKTGSITYFLGRMLISVKNIAMANIIAGETVVPELIQNDCNAEKIYAEVSAILDSPEKMNTIKEKFTVLRNKLGERIASETAADEITKFIYDHTRS